MKNRTKFSAQLLATIIVLIVVPASFILLFSNRATESTVGAMNISELLGAEDSAGFRKAIAVRQFNFPADHGPHPSYRDEWWYITGNLWDKKNHRYSYQLTFFRRALSAKIEDPLDRPSTSNNWQDNNIYMAHFAISDHNKNTFVAIEKFGRSGAGVAGAQSSPFRVWLDDWQVQSSSTNPGQFFPLTIQAQNEFLSLELTLSSDKPIVLQGDRGLSQKSAETGNASYYYSLTRLQSNGTINYRNHADENIEVNGSSWLDREWSTSALSREQQGWDWFALQLDSGEELMYYRLRQQDGQTSPYSAGIVVSASGATTALDKRHVQLTPVAYWEKSNHRFPIKWRMQITDDNGQRRDWIVSAAIKDQLLDLSVRYWEGAVDVFDQHTQQPVGVGFLEMTLY